jgi:hypothetical protein
MDGVDLMEGVDLVVCPPCPFCPSRPCNSRTQSATASAVVKRLAMSSARRGSWRLHCFSLFWRKNPHSRAVAPPGWPAPHWSTLALSFSKYRWLCYLQRYLGAAAGTLDHLVVCMVALVNVAIAETDGHVETKRCYLKALKLAIAAMGWNQVLSRLRFFGRRLFHRLNVMVSGAEFMLEVKYRNIYNMCYYISELKL